ncbi:MAG: hypothetical protein ACRCXB_03730 [Aeromonadaceae bacterium]
MPIKEINGRRYDFQEMSLEDSLEIEEMIPVFVSAYQGKAMPKGTLMQVARKVFAWCMVDGKEMGDPATFFASKDMRAEFHLALMEGLKLNFADVFIQLLGSLAGKAKASELMEKMSGLMTSSQATQGEQR